MNGWFSNHQIAYFRDNQPGERLIVHQLVEQGGRRRGSFTYFIFTALLQQTCVSDVQANLWMYTPGESDFSEGFVEKKETQRKGENSYTLAAIFWLICNMVSSSPVFETKDQNTQNTRLNVQTKVNCSDDTWKTDFKQAHFVWRLYKINPNQCFSF